MLIITINMSLVIILKLLASRLRWNNTIYTSANKQPLLAWD